MSDDLGAARFRLKNLIVINVVVRCVFIVDCAVEDTHPVLAALHALNEPRHHLCRPLPFHPITGLYLSRHAVKLPLRRQRYSSPVN